MEIKPNNEQKAVIEAAENRIACVAGAGTGKTFVLTRRIVEMIDRGVSPGNILALTFTNKSAREMVDRIADLTDQNTARKLTIGTFHSLCARWLRYYASISGLPLSKKFTIFDDIDSRYILDSVRQEVAPSLSKKRLAEYGRKTWFQTHNGKCSEFDKPEFRIWMEYHARLMASDATDFDGLLELFHLLIVHSSNEVLRKHSERFRYILVDEFQDTDSFQWDIVRDVFTKAIDFGAKLFIVGDYRQSIYSFRGAKVKILSKEILGDDRFVSYPLTKNYRSTNHIVDVANRIDGAMDFSLGEKYKLFTTRQGLRPSVKRYITQEDEAHAVAESIKLYLSGGLDHKDIAVLFRAHYQSRTIEHALDLYGIPYHHVGGDSDFWESIPARMVLRSLRLAANNNDDLSFLFVVNWPRQRLGDLDIARLRTYSAIHSMSLYRSALDNEWALENIIDLVSFIKSVDRDTSITESLFKLDEYFGVKNTELFPSTASSNAFSIETVSDLAEEQRCNSVGDFLDWYSTRHQQDRIDGAGDVVTLSTVHGAKGLEWPVVHLVGMIDGRFPIKRADYQEELRLFYVAVTRARDDLIVSNSVQFGRIRNTVPSPFLSFLDYDTTPNDTLPSMPAGESVGLK